MGSVPEGEGPALLAEAVAVFALNPRGAELGEPARRDSLTGKTVSADRRPYRLTGKAVFC
jgi:hypothetical protein